MELCVILIRRLDRGAHMIYDVVRKLIVPGEEYEFLLYWCESPYDGIHIEHIEFTSVDYEYALVSDIHGWLRCNLYPTQYLAEKAQELLKNKHTEIIKVKT